MRLAQVILFIVTIVAVLTIASLAIFLSLDPKVRSAGNYIESITLEDPSLKILAENVSANCPSEDKECKVNEIYRFVVENFEYYEDIGGQEVIKSSEETISQGGGDCEDLTILLVSLLENLGIRTYLVLTEGHAYSLVCGVDTKKLEDYGVNSLKEIFAKQLSKNSNIDVVVEEGQLKMVEEDELNLSLEGGQLYYYGGNGENFQSPITSLEIFSEINSNENIGYYVVPSKSEMNNLAEGILFTHFSECNILGEKEFSRECSGLGMAGGIVLFNKNSKKANIHLKTKFSYNYDSSNILKDKFVTSYLIDGQKCVVLESTAGEYGLAGVASENLTSAKIAFDSQTGKYYNLG
jgi:hypothetical protein